MSLPADLQIVFTVARADGRWCLSKGDKQIGAYRTRVLAKARAKQLALQASKIAGHETFVVVHKRTGEQEVVRCLYVAPARRMITLDGP